jgi:Carboxypeptidase regulatory-like domain
MKYCKIFHPAKVETLHSSRLKEVRLRNMIKAKQLLILSLLLMLFPVLVLGQQTSSVTGVVTDATGAVISGADVKLTDTKTAKQLSTKTNEQGVYAFLKVSPGIGYTLTFSVTGFETLEIKNVTLGVGITETHNAQMSVGQVTNTVTITSSEGGTLNTTDATIGNVIDQRRLHELPLRIRESPAALLGLQPGALGSNVVGTNTISNSTESNLVGSVTGARADQGNITIDGIDANDQTTGQAFATVGNAPIDAIQEFRTVTSNPGAADGRSSGGQIMLVTKGGTNQFHGSLREYNRTAATAANTFFNNKTIDPNTGLSVARPQLTRNQFGGNIGGPVYLPGFNGKDKLFFFFDYEGRRDAQEVAYLRTVPLDHFRNGSLAYLNNTPGCSTNARLDTNPECITILSPAQVAGFDPQSVGANQALLGFINGRYPQANDLTAGDGINTGGFRFNSPSRRSGNTYTTRIDLNATDRQKVFGRFNFVRSLQTDTLNTVAQQFPGDPESGQIANRDYAFVGGHNWNISSSLVNQATVGVTRSSLDFLAPFAPVSPNIFGFGAGLDNPYADISTQNRRVPTPTIRDDLSWVKGSHSMAFGVSIKPIRSKTTLVNDFNFANIGIGGLIPNLEDGLRPTDIGMDDNLVAINNYDAAFPFLLGRYANINTNFNYDTAGNAIPLANGKVRDYRYNEYEVYAQDSWKVRNDLTISYGLRWHYYPAPYEVNGFQSGTDVDLLSLFVLRAQNGANSISGVGSEPLLSYDLIGRANNAREFYRADKNNFAPRFSFSWNPSFRNGFLSKAFGDRKTVIRGGGAVIYDRTGGALTFLSDQNSYIFDNSASLQYGGDTATAALLNNPRFTSINSLPAQNMAPTITRPLTPFIEDGIPVGNRDQQSNYAIDQGYRTPYSIQYSFGFQRELPQNFILEMAYVGRQARKLFGQADAAQVVDFIDPDSGQSMIAAFNALQSQLQPGATGVITAQPWFENQIFPGATDILADSILTPLIIRGDTADTLQFLYANGLLNPNVGLSSQFAVNAYVSNLGSSSYNGMLLSLRRRFSQGLQFDFNYTYSRSIDNQSNIVNTTFGGLMCDFRNLRACRGNSDFDIRHLINVNGIYELPFGKGKAIGGNAGGFLNALIGGWQVGGIFSYRSGLPFNAITSSFPVGFFTESPVALTGAGTGPLQGQINDAADGTIQFFSDPDAALAAMRAPLHGESGNRNVLRGPGLWNVDTSVLKNFKLPWSETLRMQFRWESYNAFNHNAFGLPDANLLLPTFGQITRSATLPREMQFALRLEF